MKNPLACLLACSGLFLTTSLSAQLSENSSRISILNGLNTFANSSSNDSIFFLKGGINLGVQGNYYWKNLGIAGRVGYFTNNASEGKLADFGLSRKAVPDRALIATKPYKGYYWMAGPSFQTSFSRWQVESTVLGGLFHHDDAGVYIGDRVSPDIVYYRNKIEAGSAFAWNVGFGLNYAISSLVGLGISADYMSTQSDVINTDINRNGGNQQQALTEQANFLSTALKLTYSLHGSRYDHRNGRSQSTVQNKRSQPIKSYFETGDKPTASQKTTDCDCENKVTDITYLEPLTIDITFNTLAEAQEFLKTTSPLYDDKGVHGENPMYTKREAGSGIATGRRQYKPIVANYDESTNTFEVNGKYYTAAGRETGSGIATGKRSSIAIDESGVHRGMMVRDSNGEQVFAVLPATVNLEQLSYLEGSTISVHVQNQNQLKAQNNNTVRSNRTDNALISNKDDQDENGQPNTLKIQNNNTVRSNRTDNALFDDNDGLLDIVLYTTAEGKASAKIFRNKLKNFFEEGDRPTGEQYVARETGSGIATGRRTYKPMTVLFDEESNVIDINGTVYEEVKTSFAILLGSAIPIRIVAGDDETAKAIVTNNTTRGGSATLNSQTSSTRQTQGASFGEKVRNGVATGAGAAAGAAALAPGDPIPGLDVKLKRMADGMIINAITDGNGLITAISIGEGEYEIQSISRGQWKSAEVAVKMNCGNLDKDGAANNISLKADTDGDGVAESFTSRTINTTRDNIKRQQAAAKGDKPVTHVHGDPHVDQKDGTRLATGGGTMEYSINNVKTGRCENGACAMMCTIIINDKEYQAAITSVLKTKHDTVKNSINNIR